MYHPHQACHHHAPCPDCHQFHHHHQYPHFHLHLQSESSSSASLSFISWHFCSKFSFILPPPLKKRKGAKVFIFESDNKGHWLTLPWFSLHIRLLSALLIEDWMGHRNQGPGPLDQRSNPGSVMNSKCIFKRDETGPVAQWGNASQDPCIYVLSHVQLFVTPWTVACQAPLSMRFSWQEYWSWLPFPIPGNLPDPGIEPAPLVSPSLAGRFFISEPLGKLR